MSYGFKPPPQAPNVWARPRRDDDRPGATFFWTDGAAEWPAKAEIVRLGPKPDADLLSLWTIYENPSDFPGKFVARRHEADASGSRPTGDFIVCGSLDEIRKALPPGLSNLHREPHDDLAIVETWI